MTKSKFKALFFSILLAAVAVCLSVGLAACKSDKDKDGGKYGVGEEGVYYYDKDSSTEYLMTLQSGNYMISAEGAKGYSGTYSYKEDSKSVSFKTDGGESFDATFSDDVMQLAIEGTPYTFLKRVSYTVTFVDGNSKETSSVVYGRKASAPEKDESRIFIGWYEDSSFTTPYKFDTAVTGDLTLYAYYIDIDSTIANYEVSFVADGETIYTTETQNGIVYDIPEFDGILGWWVSDTNDGDALTYKYDGQTLTEATKLFAVEEGSLGASVYDDKITWEATVSSVTVTIDGGESFSATGNSQAYDFAALGTGVHNIVVTGGSYTEELVYVVNGLSRVSNFSVYGNVLVYNAVENAQYYYISVSCGNPSHDHEMVYNGNTLTYDFSNCEMGKDGISFTVYAYAQGFVESVSDTFVYALILDGTRVTIDEKTDTASWTAVSGATGYEVYIGVGGGDSVYVETVTGTEYSFKYYDIETEIAICVKPVAPGYYSEASEEKSYEKKTLKAPEITDISDYCISWTEVDGASGYEVNINGKIIDIYPLDGEEKPATKIYVGSGNDDEDASDYFSYILDGTNVISVMALSEDGSANSQFGDAVKAEMLTMNPVLSYKNGVISWEYALAAGRYFVEYEGTVTEVENGKSFEITFTHSGENVVKVYFDENSYAEITIYTYAVIFDTRGGSSVDAIYVAKGDEVELPVATMDGYEFSAWYTLPDLTNFDQNASIEYSGDGVAVQSGAPFDSTSNQVYYAFYTPMPYTVTLTVGSGYFVDGDGNAIVDDSGNKVTTMDVTLYYNRTFTLPAVIASDTKDIFAGWFEEANNVGRMYADGDGQSLIAWDRQFDSVLYAGYYEIFKFSTAKVNNNVTVASVSKGSDINKISEVTIPVTYTIGGVEYPVGYMGSTSFNTCYNMETINIPDTVQYIATVNGGYSSGSGAFAECSSLAHVRVYATEYAAENGMEIMYYSDGTALYKKVDGSDDSGVALVYFPRAYSGKYVMPTAVDDELEYVASGNDSVKVYRDVVAIESQVFANKYYLTEIEISYTVQTVDIQAFYKVTNLTTVVFDEAPAGESASLTIRANAFQGCTALESVTLPSHLSSFDVSIFDGCTALSYIDVVREGGNFTSRDGYLCDGTGTQLIFAPSSVTVFDISDTRITSIGAEAFINCGNLSSVTINGAISSIGEGAFKNRTSLKTLTFNGTATSSPLTIEESAFYGCTNLTSVTLPGNLVSIGANAFGGCTSLTTVDIESAVENPDFAENAFISTSGDAYVTTVNIGAGMGLLNIVAVFGDKVATVTVADGNGYYSVDEQGILYNKEKTEIAYCPYDVKDIVLPDSLEKIGTAVFMKRTSLESIVIGAKVSEIGESAFYGCTSLKTVTISGAKADGEAVDGESSELTILADAFSGCTAMESIAMPERLTYIGSGAFAGCTSLESFTITKNVQTVGEDNDSGSGASSVRGVFSDCTSLTEIKVEEGNLYYKSVDGLLCSYDGTQIYYAPSGYSGDNGTFTVPKEVTKILDYSFEGNVGITALAFDSGGDLGTLEIGAYAFKDCTSLSSVNLPEGIKSLAEGVFSGCTALTQINIPSSVESLGMKLFAGDENLATVTFTQRTGDNPTKLEIAGNTTDKASSFSDLTGLTSISLPEGTTEVPAYAFSGCTSLATVNIPSTVTEIGDYAFYMYDVSRRSYSSGYDLGVYNYEGMTALSITFAGESQLVSIGSYSFAGTDLAGADFSDTKLVSIGTYAFRYSRFGNVAFPETLTGVGNYAFEVVVADEVELPGVETLGMRAFNESLIKSISVGSIKSVGTECFQNSRELVSVEFTSGTFSEAELEAGGLTFGNYCFNYCTKLTSIDLPDTTYSLGDACFNHCEVLAEISIPAHVSSIGSSCFAYCYALAEVEFEVDGTTGLASLKSLSNSSVFSNCTSLTSVSFPASVSTYSVSFSIFGSCSALEYIYLSESVTEYSNYSSLANMGITIEVSENSQNFSMIEGLPIIFNYEKTVIHMVSASGWDALSGELDLTNLTYTEDGQSKTAQITEISDYAFEYCTQITKVTLPKTLTSLGGHAFYYCTGLQTVEFEESINITTLGTYAFSYCTGLSEIALPATMTSLSDRMFEYCKSLESIDLSNVTTLGARVFQYSGLTEVTIPAGITSTSTYLFLNCESLTSVTFEAEYNITMNNYMFQNCTALTSVTLPTATGFSSIGTYAFDGCSSLTSINLPSNVTSLGNYAFRNTGLTSVDLTYITSFGTYLFYGCSNLTSVTWPNYDVTDELSGANYMFYGCGFASIELPDTITALPTYFLYGNTSLTSVTLPAGITAVPQYFAYGCTSLGSVTFEGTVTSIGQYAFYNCSKLASIDTSSVTTITDGGNVFYGCASLTEIDLSGITSFSSASTYANIFYGCTSLEKVILSDNLSMITNSMFKGCTALEDINIPSGLTTIGTEAFSGCTSLTEMTIPYGVTVIAEKAFQGDTALESVDIQGSVTAINNYAFDGCTALSEITLPVTLETLGTYAFQNCTSLETVTIPATIESIGANTFCGSGLTRIVIPESVTSVGASAFQSCYALEEVWVGSAVASLGSNAFAGVTGDIYIVNTTGYMEETFPDWESTTGFVGTAYYYLDIDPEDVEFNEEGTAYRYNYWYVEDGAVVKIDYSPVMYAATDCFVLYNEVLDSVVGIYCFDDESEEYIGLGIVSCTSEGEGYTIVVSVEEEEYSYSVVLDDDTMTATVTAVG